MLIPIEEIIPQPEAETKLWRYMDFAKFMSLIHSSSLFFCQVKRFEDTFEGSLQGWLGDVPSGSDFEKEAIAFYNHPRGLRAYSAVSCWYMSEHESAAMWKLYLTNNQGIAIQTTVGKLTESLSFKWDKMKVYKGAVIYGEIPTPSPGQGMSGEIALFRKQPQFSHEMEYRIALIAAGLQTQLDQAGGLKVSTNLDTLIERIYIAPSAPLWIKHLINSILETKYNLEKPVILSNLDHKAAY